MFQLNEGVLDRYTIGHIAVGVLLGLFGLTLKTSVNTAISFEFLERKLKKEKPGWFPENGKPESIPNSIMDVLAVAVGWVIIKKLPGR